MHTPRAHHYATNAAFVLLTIFLLINTSSQSTSMSSSGSNGSANSDFFKDFDSWIQKGCEQYGEPSTNKSITAEVTVGTGEEYGNIQDALNAGYSCLYLKKQRFNITQPITPPKEDFYIISNGAEIFATEPIHAVFEIHNTRYAHLDGLFINGLGLAEKCIDAMCTPSQVPVHQIRNCKIWGATTANIDLTGCEDSLIFNCWIDGRKINDTPNAITEYGVKIGEQSDGYKTGGQINLIHCLMSFHRNADVFAKNIAQLKLANCLLASKTEWSEELEAHIIVEGGTGENSLQPTLELTSCWLENGHEGNVPNILVQNHLMSKLAIIGGMFYTDKSPNIYSSLNPCAETITIIGALLEHNMQYEGYNVAAPAQKLVSIGNTYNWNGIDKTNLTEYLIFDRDSGKIETNAGHD